MQWTHAPMGLEPMIPLVGDSISMRYGRQVTASETSRYIPDLFPDIHVIKGKVAPVLN
jgi:hypothetical protein